MTLSLHLALVVTGQIQMPGEPPPIVKPQSAANPGYLEFLEQNSHIIYPVLGVVVLVLIAAGILSAWKSQDLDGVAKAELKREVILELRRDMGGTTAEHLAKATGLEPFRMNKLLEEMQRDGILMSYTSTTNKRVWRMKGVGPESSGEPSDKKRAAGRR